MALLSGPHQNMIGIRSGKPPVVVVGEDPFFSSVEFLSHFDGTEGATTAVDHSKNSQTITFVDNAELDTAQKVFGTASLLLDGTGDCVTVPAHSRYAFGSGDWTMEGRAWWDVVTGGQKQLFGVWQSATASRQIALYYDSTTNTIQMLLSSTGSTTIIKISGSWIPSLNTWYDVAMDFDGTTYRVYVDGVVKGSTTGLVALYDNTASIGLSVGAQFNAAFEHRGQIDEVRITKGVARYAGAYTIATEAFPNS